MRPTSGFLLACLAAILLAMYGIGAAPDESDTFFRSASVPEIRIEIAKSHIEKLTSEPRTYVPFVLWEGGKVVATGGGAKLKGAAGSFQEVDQRPSLTLKLDKFGGKGRFHGLTRFHLNNSVQDESLLSEWTCADILRAARYPTPRVAHARVFLNERDLGIYVLKESFDAAFIKRHFANATGTLYDGGFCQDIDAELERDSGPGPADSADLKALAAACSESDMVKRWEALEKLVDIPAFVRFMALEMMLGHWDGYSLNSNNYRLYFEPGGKAHFLPHGMDQAFQDPEASILDHPRSLVASSVMSKPEWRALYRTEVTRLLPEFDSTRLAARIEALQKTLQPALQKMNDDAARAHADSARDFVERLVAREQNLREQCAAPEPAPLTFAPGIAVVITDWRGESESEDAVLEKTDADDAPWYRVACGPTGQCVAGWRRRVLLPKGRFRFEAFVRSVDIERLQEDDAPGIGAGLRISGKQRSNDGLETAARTVAFEFEVAEETALIDLVLELRASKGSAEFKIDSLKLTKLDEPQQSLPDAEPLDGEASAVTDHS